MNTEVKPIAITMGDPAGIGPEIIAMLWRDHPRAMADVVVYGDPCVMARACELVGVPLPIHALRGRHCKPDGTAMSTLPHYGAVSAAAGLAAAHAVEDAAQAALCGIVSAIVTAPLHKESLARAGLSHPGHTELLQALCAQHLNRPIDALPVRMMLANDELRVVLVTIHMPLRAALESLNQTTITQTITMTNEFLRRIGITQPRIAVAGVNPHAGEGGLFGREELDIVAPAITHANGLGAHSDGPFAPDTIFLRAKKKAGEQRGEFDAVIAMYHDQGLIPVKYLGLDCGVNVTLGLPLIRTSPDHGTAFDIAGSGQANPAGLLYALKQAQNFVKLSA